MVIVEIVSLLILLSTLWTVRYPGWRRRLGAREGPPLPRPFNRFPLAWEAVGYGILSGVIVSLGLAEVTGADALMWELVCAGGGAVIGVAPLVIVRRRGTAEAKRGRVVEGTGCVLWLVAVPLSIGLSIAGASGFVWQ